MKCLDCGCDEGEWQCGSGECIPISKVCNGCNGSGYDTGTEYIGSYHIHPTEGPMRGALHTKSSHPKLYYSDQIPLSIGKKDTTDEDYEKYIKDGAPSSNGTTVNLTPREPAAVEAKTADIPF